MKRMRKNNKGFSLVELIIVIAIMVALIAVMGPQYIKYVKSSRDAVVSTAAQDVLSVAKSEFALANLSLTGDGAHTIKVGRNSSNKIDVVLTGITEKTGTNFKAACGLDTAKDVTSDMVYTITVTAGVDEGVVFAMDNGEETAPVATVGG